MEHAIIRTEGNSSACIPKEPLTFHFNHQQRYFLSRAKRYNALGHPQPPAQAVRRPRGCYARRPSALRCDRAGRTAGPLHERSPTTTPAHPAKPPARPTMSPPPLYPSNATRSGPVRSALRGPTLPHTLTMARRHPAGAPRLRCPRPGSPHPPTWSFRTRRSCDN